MAQPTTLKFGAGLVYLSRGDTPETFLKICGTEGSEFSISKDTSSAAVPDCDNPDKPAWTVSDVTAMSWEMSLDGFMVPDAQEVIEAATLSSVARKLRIYEKGTGSGGATPDKLYEGMAHVTFTKSGKLGDKFRIKLSCKGDGELTIKSAAAP